MEAIAVFVGRTFLFAARFALLLVHVLASSVVQNTVALWRGIRADRASLRDEAEARGED